MRKAWGGALLGLAMAVASMQAVAIKQAPIEASMQVTGTLSIDAAGAVSGFTLDEREKLPAQVTALLERTLPALRFERTPNGEGSGPVQAKMTLQVLATQADAEHMTISLHHARFVEAEPPITERISVKHRVPLQYPHRALDIGVTATVYVAVRIDRNGRAIDAQARQVNLGGSDSEAHMRQWREMFAKPTVEAVRHFTFTVPTTGPNANDADFSGVLSVNYVINGEVPRYGQWTVYVPGPKAEIAWLDREDAADDSEAVRDGEFAQSGTGLKLLTPIGGG
jgi:hypothetical protein